MSHHTVYTSASRWTGSLHTAAPPYSSRASPHTLLPLDAAALPVLSSSWEVSAFLRGMVCGELILSRSGPDFPLYLGHIILTYTIFTVETHFSLPIHIADEPNFLTLV